MAYEVLARKWRPQLFESVVGQDHVTRTLQNAIRTGRLANAYLFVGPRGTGKTSIARIFARALNCVTGPTLTPCGVCDSCREIAAGNSLDVMEVDGASNNGVEKIRDLRDTVMYAPTHGKFKIYLIDEVHMLSSAAFNALLKTLEEPPAHVKFLFATTEPDKILATILSRCQRFDLRRIPVALIVERLRLIASDEKVDADEDALLAVARAADGGLRDAESSLDQLISFKGNVIREADVLGVFGLVARSQLESMARCILQGDVAGLLGGVHELDAAGKDLSKALTELMEHFRQLMLVAGSGNAEGLTDLTERQMQAVREQSAMVSLDRILRLLDMMCTAADQMRYTLSRRTLLETTLIRCARAAGVASLPELWAQVRELQAALGAGGVAVAPGPAPEQKKNFEMKPPEVRHAVAPAATVQDDITVLREAWKDVQEQVGRISMAARHALSDAHPMEVDGARVVVAFEADFAQEKAAFDQIRNRKAVEMVLGRVLKRTVQAEFVVGRGLLAGTPEVMAGSPAAAPVPARGGRETAVAGDTDKHKQYELINDPKVQRVLELFDGQVTDVRT